MTKINTKSVIIWDFDGTLVDTGNKNYQVTQRIVTEISGHPAKSFSALHSLVDYKAANARSQNWRLLYKNEFCFDDQEIDCAGRLWTEYQLADEIKPVIVDGIDIALKNLSGVSQGIVSQNGKDNIKTILANLGIEQYFRAIIGYEEVGLDKQKPHPAGFLTCLKLLRTESTRRIYSIGDHETDVIVANNARQCFNRMAGGIDIITIGVNYDHGSMDWNNAPDYLVTRPEDIVNIIV
ncbi:MAG: HAD family hydrolase [Candidatus Marinimicrobia bacterium]|nr:HAD family hydrolase [Candidatus Neomarinimicrobiota bacterium]